MNSTLVFWTDSKYALHHCCYVISAWWNEENEEDILGACEIISTEWQKYSISATLVLSYKIILFQGNKSIVVQFVDGSSTLIEYFFPLSDRFCFVPLVDGRWFFRTETFQERDEVIKHFDPPSNNAARPVPVSENSRLSFHPTLAVSCQSRVDTRKCLSFGLVLCSGKEISVSWKDYSETTRR